MKLPGRDNRERMAAAPPAQLAVCCQRARKRRTGFAPHGDLTALWAQARRLGCVRLHMGALRHRIFSSGAPSIPAHWTHATRVRGARPAGQAGAAGGAAVFLEFCSPGIALCVSFVENIVNVFMKKLAHGRSRREIFKTSASFFEKCHVSGRARYGHGTARAEKKVLCPWNFFGPCCAIAAVGPPAAIRGPEALLGFKKMES